MKKIFFLFKNKTKFLIIFHFLFNKFTSFFYKKKQIRYKRAHQYLLRNKKITNDYFSKHSYYFYHYLKKFNKNFKYLEIGSYEGNSSIFVAKNFKDAHIYCVDNWVGTEEYNDDLSFSKIEKNFDFNILRFKKINKIKSSSDYFFKNNKVFFDVIYIDGYHFGPQVYKDCVNAWKILKKNGMMICDDYILDCYKDITKNPCYAINKFLNEIRNSFKILKISNSQIFIKKNIHRNNNSV